MKYRFQLRLVAAFLIVLGLFTACSVTITGPGMPARTEPPPTEEPAGEQGRILSFTADRTEIPPGECLTLRWEAEGGFGVLLNGQQVERVGQMLACPTDTTPYVLELDLGHSIDRRELLVSVAGGEPGLSEEPRLSEESSPGEPAGEPRFEIFLTADRTELPAGECTVLAWRVEGPDEIEMRAWLNEEPVDRFGEREVCPKQTTVYAVKAGVGESFDSREVVINVIPREPMAQEELPQPAPTEPRPEAPTFTPPAPTAPPLQPAQPSQPVVIDFWVDDNDITAGDCTTLRWHVANANAVHLDGVGVIGDDTKKICPTTTSVYVLHVAYDAGSSEKKVTVKVSGASPPGGGSTGVLTADLKVTDLYPDKQPQGKVFARVTNNGPQGVSNVTVKLYCSVAQHQYVTGQVISSTTAGNLTINLAAGQTQAFDTGIAVQTDKYWYWITCLTQAPFNDIYPNDSYSEPIPPPP